jgi:hypothetical protein
MKEEFGMPEVRKVSREEFLAHIEEMKRLTGHDGSAPRSKQPRINVRELVAAL